MVATGYGVGWGGWGGEGVVVRVAVDEGGVGTRGCGCEGDEGGVIRVGLC